jgi:hypothetical protein
VHEDIVYHVSSTALPVYRTPCCIHEADAGQVMLVTNS